MTFSFPSNYLLSISFLSRTSFFAVCLYTLFSTQTRIVTKIEETLKFCKSMQHTDSTRLFVWRMTKSSPKNELNTKTKKQFKCGKQEKISTLHIGTKHQLNKMPISQERQTQHATSAFSQIELSSVRLPLSWAPRQRRSELLVKTFTD